MPKNKLKSFLPIGKDQKSWWVHTKFIQKGLERLSFAASTSISIPYVRVALDLSNMFPISKVLFHSASVNPIAYSILRLSQLPGGGGIFIPHPRKQC